MSDSRYDRLIEVKERLLDHKKRELETAVLAVDAVLAEIGKIEQEVAEAYSVLTGQRISGRDFSVLVDYLSHLDLRKDLLFGEKKEKEAHVHEIRQELLNLEIERKMLEKLKSKLLQTIKKTEAKKEQKLMDNLAFRG